MIGYLKLFKRIFAFKKHLYINIAFKQNIMKIDLKTRRILTELDLDGRMPITELSKKASISRQVAEYRINQMKKEGLVLGTIPIFDSVVVGQNWYRILLRLLKATKEQKNEFISYLKNHSNISWVGEVGGNWDMVLNFICRDHFQFNQIFEEMASKFGSCIRDYEILIYIDVHDLQRRYILPTPEKHKELYHEMKFNPNFSFDKLNKNIVRELNIDASRSNLEIGQKLGVSGNTIKNRINEMTTAKLILGFRLWLSPQLLGYKSQMLFLGINRLDIKREKLLYSYLKQIPNVVFLVKHIGRWRIGLEIETKDDREFQEIFVDIRGKFSDIITEFESFPLLKDHLVNYFPEGCLE